MLITIGTAFCIWAIFSACIGNFYYHQLFLLPFLQSVAQYAFVLIMFPILAVYFLKDKVHTAIKLICLSYFPPMLFNVLLIPDNAPGILRTLFFYSGRALGTYGNANSFSLVLILVLPLYVYLATLPEKSWKILSYVGQVLSLLCTTTLEPAAKNCVLFKP